MDDKQKLEESIKQQFQEFEGIIDLLRGNSFSQLKYKKFYETLARYYEIIKDNLVMDREIAGYLQTFHMYLYSIAKYTNGLQRKEIDEAWSETLQLMLKFYPSM